MTPVNKSNLLALNSVRSSYGQIHKTKQDAIMSLKWFKIAIIELQTGLHAAFWVSHNLTVVLKPCFVLCVTQQEGLKTWFWFLKLDVGFQNLT